MANALILLFEQLPPLEPQQIAGELAAIELPSISVAADSPLSTPDGLLLNLKFAPHAVRLVGLNAPVPQNVMEHTVQASHLQAASKAALRRQQAQIIAYYEGSHPDPAEQLLILYKLASCFKTQGLLGTLDETAWNCAPASTVAEFGQARMLAEYRQHWPLHLWTGFVRFIKSDNTTWFCTKGNHRFGVIDFAYLGQSGDGGNTFHLFFDLFFYMYRSKAKLLPGHTAEFDGNTFLRFRDVYEYKDYLTGPAGTLVIEKISASEINRK